MKIWLWLALAMVGPTAQASFTPDPAPPAVAAANPKSRGPVVWPTRQCKPELDAMSRVHAATRLAIGTATLARIQLATLAHGKRPLAWYASLLERFVQDNTQLHPKRAEFLRASSAYLLCLYGQLEALPEVQPNRDKAIMPADWVLPGDLLFTDSGCAMFMRGEVAGLPGHGALTDRMTWRWTGTCPGGVAEGPGEAFLVMRSGEARAGALGQGFAPATFRQGRLAGRIQMTDGTRAAADWRDHFDEYRNGRLQRRLQRNASGEFQAVSYVQQGNDWVWVAEVPAKR